MRDAEFRNGRRGSLDRSVTNGFHFVLETGPENERPSGEASVEAQMEIRISRRLIGRGGSTLSRVSVGSFKS